MATASNNQIQTAVSPQTSLAVGCAPPLLAIKTSSTVRDPRFAIPPIIPPVQPALPGYCCPPPTTGPGSTPGAAGNIDEVEWDISVTGEQTIVLPVGTLKVVSVYLNGVRQPKKSYIVVAGTLILPALIEATAGDIVLAEIIT